MIGIDCTSINRWQNLRTHIREKIAKYLKQTNSEPLEMAKVWACNEAIYKAIGRKPNGRIIFERRKSPTYVGDENIVLSLTHEGDLVIAVALLQ